MAEKVAALTSDREAYHHARGGILDLSARVRVTREVPDGGDRLSIMDSTTTGLGYVNRKVPEERGTS